VAGPNRERAPMNDGSLTPVVRLLALAPDLDELARARRFVSDAATQAGFADSRVFDIMVACSEAAANAIEHAPVKGEVTVKTFLYPDRLEIEIQGPGAFETPHKLANGHLHRGLGLPLMAQFSDHLALYSGPGGGTLVTLTFYRPGAEGLRAETIGERKLAEDTLQAELIRTEVLRAIAAKAAETSDVRALARCVLDLCRELLGAKTGLVHEADEQAGLLLALALVGYPEDFVRVVREMTFDDPVAPSAIAYRDDVVVTYDWSAVPEGMADRERLAGITTYRWIALPIHVKGEAIGALGLTFEERRPFTKSEIDLFQAVADQLGVGIARARAEAALRENEEKYKDLFDSIDQGFFILDVLLDHAGRVTDLCVVEANPAAMRMLGRDLAGCHLRDLAPAFDESWNDSFGRVALTGESVSLRQFSEVEDRWYDLYVFRIGGAGSRRVGEIFLDVTDEVRAESNLRLVGDIDKTLSGSLPAGEMFALVGAKLGEHLAVDNFMLAEAEEASDRAVVLFAWRDERAAELLRTYGLSELNGPDYWQAMHSGDPFVVRDTERDPRTDAGRHSAFHVGAYIVIPFDRDGKWKYLVSVDSLVPRDWTSREVALVKEVAGRVIARIERACAEEELLRSRGRYAFLLRFTDSMRPLGEVAAIQAKAARLLGKYLRADRCAYAEVEGDELVVLGQYRHGVEPLPSRLAFRPDVAGQGRSGKGPAAAPRRGEPMAIVDVDTDGRLGEADRAQLRAAQTRALAGAVVVRDKRPVASMACHSSRPREWAPEELELIQEVAERTWAAAERVKAEAALRESEERHRALAEENERLFRQQLDIAEHLQMALLNIPSDIGRVRLGHLYRSATEAAKVGGDFYDVFEVKDGNIAILMGDVAGHGIQAARTGTLVKDVVHAFTHQSLRTHEVLRRTNLLLIEKDLPGFVTLFLGILDPDAGTLRYSSAGHTESMVRRLTGEIEMLGSGSSPLGVYPDAAWKPHEIELGAGEVLLLYTDGVTEARRDKELFGEKRLERLLKRKRISVGRLPHLILDQILAFSGGSLQDDAAVLALCLTEYPQGASPSPGPVQQSLLDGLPGVTQTLS
jgi:serine phosphatase RsbU (regulator of sigma subunit)/anti-sigma regulatory factor (Ser/Thr protein kinase)